MALEIVTRPEVAPVKPGTAMEEQLQLKGIGRLLAGFGYRYGSEVQLHQALSTVLTRPAMPTCASTGSMPATARTSGSTAW